MQQSLLFTWLGVAGVEIEFERRRLMIDPFITRFSLIHILSKIEPDRKLIAHQLKAPEAILVTHSHWDHLFDVAELARSSGCQVFGSATTCRLLTLQGIDKNQLNEISAGDSFSMAGMVIQALAGSHIKTPLDHWLNKPLAPGLRPPLRPIDFHRGSVLAFRIQAGDLSLLHGKADTKADVLVQAPYLWQGSSFCHDLARVNPRLLIPIHWDDFMRPLTQPLKPMFEPVHPPFPWIYRVSLEKLAQKAKTCIPGLQVYIPELFTPYLIDSTYSQRSITEGLLT